MAEYRKIKRDIERKTGGFNFALFYRHINREIRDQIRFYAQVVDALPRIIFAVKDIIQDGKYPVLQVASFK